MADPTLSVKQNVEKALLEMPSWYYFSRPINIACHDLTTTSTTTQPGYRNLLGLGLKYCPQSRITITPQAFKRMAERFEKDMITKYLFAGKKKNNYDPKLHIASDWKPDRNKVPPELRARIAYFIRELRKIMKPRRSPPNLLRHQRCHLKEIKESNELIVIKTDKNLGPALIERATYCRWVFDDHLNDNRIFYTYEEEEAKRFMEDGIAEIEDWATTNKKLLTPVERKFLKRSIALNKENWHSHCYLMAKIHKTPMKSRLINSTAGSITHGFGVLIDRKLQPLGRQTKAFIKSSLDLKEKFLKLDDLPPTAKLFTADAVAMYTNIQTAHALKKLKNRVPNYLLEAIQILYKYNIQKFGDTYKTQHDGTAMGVSPACMWATLYFAPWEEKLMKRFKKYLIFYVRFIDDVAAAWNFCDDDSYRAFTLFQQKMNNYGILRWEFQKASMTIDFLDVTLTINNSRIDMCLFEKELNLHLYLPPSSAHPPGVLKGLIHGMIFRIIRLTSGNEKQKEFITALYRRLIYRGYSPQRIHSLFQESIHRIRHNVKNDNPHEVDRKQDNPIILHVPYHPLLASSKKIQRVFNRTLFDNRWEDPTSTPLPEFKNKGNQLGINRLIVAYHRSKNIGNYLAPRKIESTPGPPASDYL